MIPNYHISCILTVTKIRRSHFLLSKMKYFQNFEIQLSYLGYLPTKNPPHWFQKLENILECYGFFETLNFVRKCHHQKVRAAVIFGFLLFFFLSVGLFIFFEAKNFTEYSNGIYFIFLSINFLLVHPILFRQKEHLSNLMNKFNNMVQTSKLLLKSFTNSHY